MNTVQTTFAGRSHPWTGQKLNRKGTDVDKKSQPTNPDEITIADDPLPCGRASPGSKYDALFKAMKVGQCLRTLPGDVQKVAQALRKHIERTDLKHKGKAPGVISETRGADGIGRVWLVEVKK